MVALFASMLIGCFGVSSPTESDARAVLENQLGKSFQDGTIKIKSFKKVNGLLREFGGAKIYTLEYEAEIEYPNGINTKCISKNGKFMGWDCWQKETHEIGEKVKMHDEITFTLKEKGWESHVPSERIQTLARSSEQIIQVAKPLVGALPKARTDINNLMQALNTYKQDNQRYPTAEQGLIALIEKPTTAPTPSNWRPYMDKLPNDPWHRPYQYLIPGIKGETDVLSLGADGKPGGDGENADIGSWKLPN